MPACIRAIGSILDVVIMGENRTGMPYRTKPGVRSYAHITEAALAALSKARGEK